MPQMLKPQPRRTVVVSCNHNSVQMFWSAGETTFSRCFSKRHLEWKQPSPNLTKSLSKDTNIQLPRSCSFSCLVKTEVESLFSAGDWFSKEVSRRGLLVLIMWCLCIFERESDELKMKCFTLVTLQPSAEVQECNPPQQTSISSGFHERSEVMLGPWLNPAWG